MTAAAESLDFAELSRSLRAADRQRAGKLRDLWARLPAAPGRGDPLQPAGPGKRLRPQLVLMACQACGYDERQALPAACAVEMVHTYSLIHDDLPAMDDDDLRRGRPTCHARFGEATAILAGDALLALAFEVLAEWAGRRRSAARCCGELAAAAGRREPGRRPGGRPQGSNLPTWASNNWRRIHRRKTGALIRVSLRLGGIVGRADERQLAGLDTYGEKARPGVSDRRRPARRAGRRRRRSASGRTRTPTAAS